MDILSCKGIRYMAAICSSVLRNKSLVAIPFPFSPLCFEEEFVTQSTYLFDLHRSLT